MLFCSAAPNEIGSHSAIDKLCLQSAVKWNGYQFKLTMSLGHIDWSIFQLELVNIQLINDGYLYDSKLIGWCKVSLKSRTIDSINISLLNVFRKKVRYNQSISSQIIFCAYMLNLSLKISNLCYAITIIYTIKSKRRWDFQSIC